MMKTVSSLLDVSGAPGEKPQLAVTIGNFDGVHRGHQQLLRSLKDHTHPRGMALAVITFHPHPRKVLQAPAAGFLLGSAPQRHRWLAEAGVDWLVEIPFTRDFSTLSAEEFLDRHVLCHPGLREIYLGWDFAFGAHKSAGAEEVRKHCTGRGIHVEVCPRYSAGDSQVSSSHIRQCVSEGRVREAHAMLGRLYTLEGLVVKGEGRGKRLGVPTANMQVDQDVLLPKPGVYVTETASRGMLYRSVTNIGRNPTFKDGPELSVETHILDFDGDIYGEGLEVRFLDRLRDERKFPGVDALLDQIKQDIGRARAFPS